MNFDKHLMRMAEFIEIEGEEKSLEILHKGEEEANRWLGDFLIKEKNKVNSYYQRMERKLERESIGGLSCLVNAKRNQLMKLKNKALRTALSSVHDRIADDIQDDTFYRWLFVKLVLQCLCMLMERTVGLRVCKKDEELAGSVLPELRLEFERLSGLRVHFELDGEEFLPAEAMGGVVVMVKRGTIVTDNTIRTRLKHTGQGVLSFIRAQLFGPNPHRVWL